MINRGGEKVYPVELEAFLLSHPSVKEVGVIGVPDEVLGEQVCAWIVLKADKAPLTAKSVRAYCRKGKVLQRAIPKYVFFLPDALPKTTSGKTHKPTLLNLFEEKRREYTTAKQREQLVESENMDETEWKVLSAAREILTSGEDLGHEDLSLNDEFADVGFSSMQLVRLATRLQQTLGITLPANVMFQLTSVKQIANFINSHSRSGYEGEPPVLSKLRKDMQLDEDIQFERHRQTKHAQKEVVLLTGATGFLGIHLLSSLLSEPDVKEVICIVRATDDVDAENRVRKLLSQYKLDYPIKEEGREPHMWGERVKVLAGDVSQPFMGLPGAQYGLLAQSVTTVYHCAATVHWLLPVCKHLRPRQP